MLIDSNEAIHCPWLLEAFPDAIIKHLDIGDIAADDMSTIIERKTMDDLWSSITDGRYKDQIRTLMELPSFVIIVGEMSQRNVTFDHMKITNGAISSLRFKYRIPTFIVKDNDEFVKLVTKIFEKRNNIENMDIVVKRKHNDPQLNLFCSIPNIGAKKAKVLYEKYNSIHNLCQATIEDIESMPGFGNKTAKTILSTLRNDII